jgi:hypothetical protein
VDAEEDRLSRLASQSLHGAICLDFLDIFQSSRLLDVGLCALFRSAAFLKMTTAYYKQAQPYSGRIHINCS